MGGGQGEARKDLEESSVCFRGRCPPELVRGWGPGRALPAADGTLRLVCAGSRRGLPLAPGPLGEPGAICFHFGDPAGRLSSRPGFINAPLITAAACRGLRAPSQRCVRFPEAFARPA